MNYKVIAFLVCISGTFAWSRTASGQNRSLSLSPVIFVPGDGGSQLDAKLNKNASVHYFCTKKSDWFNIWLNLELLAPLVIDCWIDNVKLYYDNKTRTTSNTPGVQTRIPGWSDPLVVEWIDPTKASAGAYFKDIANQLVKLGYERNKSIYGAPYDFRKGPSENPEFFLNLKELVESVYEYNNRQPVTFITHSMGSPMTLIFLQRQTQAWKSKYVARLVSIAGAWAGSVKAVKVFAIGDDLDSFALSGSTMRQQQISNPSTAFLLPSPLFWKPSEIVLETPSKKYTVSTLEQFFDHIDYKTGWEMRKDNIKYMMNFSPPGVELHCIYGSGIPTIEKMIFSSEKIVGQTPTYVKKDGDGTVNARSLKACMHWAGYQRANVSMYEVRGADHISILANAQTLSFLSKIMAP